MGQSTGCRPSGIGCWPEVAMVGPECGCRGRGLRRGGKRRFRGARGDRRRGCPAARERGAQMIRFLRRGTAASGHPERRCRPGTRPPPGGVCLGGRLGGWQVEGADHVEVDVDEAAGEGFACFDGGGVAAVLPEAPFRCFLRLQACAVRPAVRRMAAGISLRPVSRSASGVGWTLTRREWDSCGGVGAMER